MTRHFFAVPLAALLVIACVPSASDDPFRETLQGTWSSCLSDGTTDTAERLTFSGDALEWTVSSFETADATCAGAETVTSHFSGAFTVGGEIEATLRGAPIIARGLDVTDSTQTFYTTVFVNDSATPRVLHVGLADPSTDRDMTSGAKRPVVLGATPLAQR